MSAHFARRANHVLTRKGDRMGVILPIAAGLLIAGWVAFAVLRRRRKRARDVPELNRHPERLEQMLDSTDDA
jgi:hypothetical protein